MSKEGKERMIASKKGKKLTDKHKMKMSETHKKIGTVPPHPVGVGHYRWLGGKSFEPYSLDWTNKLKEAIRIRDNKKCQICNIKQGKEKLAVHHIDYNKENCNPENLVALCRSCHAKTNGNRKLWTIYFKDMFNVRNYLCYSEDSEDEQTYSCLCRRNFSKQDYINNVIPNYISSGRH